MNPLFEGVTTTPSNVLLSVPYRVNRTIGESLIPDANPDCKISLFVGVSVLVPLQGCAEGVPAAQSREPSHY